MGKNAQNLSKVRAAQKEEARERQYRVDLEKNPEIMEDLGLQPIQWKLGDGQTALYEWTELTELSEVKRDTVDVTVDSQWKLAYRLIEEQFNLLKNVMAVLDNEVPWEKYKGNPLLVESVKDRIEWELGKLSANSTRLLVRNWDKPVPGFFRLDRAKGIGRFMACEACRDQLDRISHNHPDVFVYDGPAPRKSDDFIIIYSWLFTFDKFESIKNSNTIRGKMAEAVKMLCMQAFNSISVEYHRLKDKESVGAIDLVDALQANDYREKRTDEPMSLTYQRVEIDDTDPNRVRIIERIRTKQTQGLRNSVGQGTIRDSMSAENNALGKIMREEISGRIVWKVADETAEYEDLQERAEIIGWATHPDREVRDTVRFLTWLAAEDSLLEFAEEGYTRLAPDALAKEWSRTRNHSFEAKQWECIYHINNPLDPMHGTGEDHACIMARELTGTVDLEPFTGIPLKFYRGYAEFQVGRQFRISPSLIKVAMGLLHDAKKEYLGHVRQSDGTWSTYPVDPDLSTKGGSLYESAIHTLQGYRHGGVIITEVELRNLAEAQGLHFESLKSAAHKVWNRHEIWSNVADERKYDRAWLTAMGYNVPIATNPPPQSTQFKGIPSTIWVNRDGTQVPVSWDEEMKAWAADAKLVNLITRNEEDWNPMPESKMKERKKNKSQAEADNEDSLLALQARVDAGEITSDMAELVKSILLG